MKCDGCAAVAQGAARTIEGVCVKSYNTASLSTECLLLGLNSLSDGGNVKTDSPPENTRRTCNLSIRTTAGNSTKIVAERRLKQAS